MEFDTTEKNQIINITFTVKTEVKNSGVQKGLCIVSIPHVSAGLILAEDEEGINKDYINLLTKLVPPSPPAKYYHDDQAHDHNGAEQLRALLLGSIKIIPVVDGKLVLGDWQSILFVELDGGRKCRRVDINIFQQ